MRNNSDNDSQTRRNLKILAGVFVAACVIGLLCAVNARLPSTRYNKITREAAGHLLNGDDSRALDLYDQAVLAAPKRYKHEALNERGKLYLRKGNFDQAISDFEEALKLSPSGHPLQETLRQQIHDAKQRKAESLFP